MLTFGSFVGRLCLQHHEKSHSTELDFLPMICKSRSTFISSHLNIKGSKMPHTFGTSFKEFGAAENFVIGKINNIYSVEMQISLCRASMNNWVRTITLNNSFLNILQCVFLWPEGKLSFVTAAVCGGNYAQRLRPFLIAGGSFFAPAGFFGEMEEKRRQKTTILLPVFLSIVLLISPRCAFPTLVSCGSSRCLFAAHEQNIDANGINYLVVCCIFFSICTFTHRRSLLEGSRGGGRRGGRMDVSAGRAAQTLKEVGN